jgi:hypothetical protein
MRDDAVIYKIYGINSNCSFMKKSLKGEMKSLADKMKSLPFVVGNYEKHSRYSVSVRPTFSNRK